MKKLARIIYYAVFALILVVAILLLLSIFPVAGNLKFLTVLSGSMAPAISTGSIIAVRPATAYAIGDIITFGPNTKTQVPTTHRIVGIRAQDGQIIYKTQGDANNAEDVKEVLGKEVIGKVYFSVPLAGYIIDFVRRPFGLILVIILPAVFIIYDEIRKIVKETKRLKKLKLATNQENNLNENV